MTITDVAGLEALPDSFAFIDSMGDIGVMLGGQAWYPETATMLAGRAIRKYGPLEVLSPRTVTPEQVEALWTRHRDAIAPITIRPGDEGRWPDAERRGEMYRRGFEAGRDAALAAMGIGVAP